jgi:hypothetical protein
VFSKLLIGFKQASMGKECQLFSLLLSPDL